MLARKPHVLQSILKTVVVSTPIGSVMSKSSKRTSRQSGALHRGLILVGLRLVSSPGDPKVAHSPRFPTRRRSAAQRSESQRERDSMQPCFHRIQSRGVKRIWINQESRSAFIKTTRPKCRWRAMQAVQPRVYRRAEATVVILGWHVRACPRRLGRVFRSFSRRCTSQPPRLRF
jgi:hypothetical protein